MKVWPLVWKPAIRFCTCPASISRHGHCCTWANGTRHCAWFGTVYTSLKAAATAPAAVVLHMIESRLRTQALDFQGAREIAEATLPDAREGFPRLITLVGLGEALLGLGAYDRAMACFDEVTESPQRSGFRLDWIFRLPLYRARGQLWLERREFDRARQDALMVCELAALPGQRTYLALGRRLLAEILMAEGRHAEAEAEIEKARAAIEGFEAPLAEWRVYATSAELVRRLDAQRADAYQARAESVRHALGLRAASQANAT